MQQVEPGCYRPSREKVAKGPVQLSAILRSVGTGPFNPELCHPSPRASGQTQRCQMISLRTTGSECARVALLLSNRNVGDGLESNGVAARVAIPWSFLYLSIGVSHATAPFREITVFAAVPACI